MSKNQHGRCRLCDLMAKQTNHSELTRTVCFYLVNAFYKMDFLVQGSSWDLGLVIIYELLLKGMWQTGESDCAACLLSYTDYPLTSIN